MLKLRARGAIARDPSGSHAEDAGSENAGAQLLLDIALFEQPGIATIWTVVRRHAAIEMLKFPRDRKRRAPSHIAKSQPRVRLVTARTTSRRNETQRHANQF
jgi:hypothetical protein